MDEVQIVGEPSIAEERQKLLALQQELEQKKTAIDTERAQLNKEIEKHCSYLNLPKTNLSTEQLNYAINEIRNAIKSVEDVHANDPHNMNSLTQYKNAYEAKINHFVSIMRTCIAHDVVNEFFGDPEFPIAIGVISVLVNAFDIEGNRDKIVNYLNSVYSENYLKLREKMKLLLLSGESILTTDKGAS